MSRVKIEKVTEEDYVLHIWHYGEEDFPEEYDNHAELTARVKELKGKGYIVENDHLV